MYELENVEITKSKVRFTLVSSENLAEPSVEGERAITPVFEIKVQRARRVNAVVSPIRWMPRLSWRTQLLLAS
jgi:hypothetical protein